MLESVHCPSCSTHYGLKAPRVRAGIRRARCFRCSSIFSVEQAVLRLTSGPEPLVEEVGIGPEDLLDLQPIPEEPPALPGKEPEGRTSSAMDATPSLTLGDLEGLEEEILEKALVVEVEEALPGVQDPLAGLAPEVTVPEDDFDSTAGGYSSARDAIAKLLGSAPAPEAPHERRSLNRTSTQMDVEATLDALETTLGGAGSKDLETKPIIPPPELTQSELEPVKPMASTMKLTHDEIMSAMKVASIPTPAQAASPAIKPAVPQPSRESSPEAETSLLKLQVGQEVYNNISMEQITTWIEQGRVQDFHMVARQFSENWIEAGKVPSLRPVFERLRRQQTPAAQQSQAVILPPPSETAPMKKSLFGGLFNRG